MSKPRMARRRAARACRVVVRAPDAGAAKANAATRPPAPPAAPTGLRRRPEHPTHVANALQSTGSIHGLSLYETIIKHFDLCTCVFVLFPADHGTAVLMLIKL